MSTWLIVFPASELGLFFRIIELFAAINTHSAR